MKVNILGHEYKVLYIEEKDIPEDLKIKAETANGLCENYSRELIVLKASEAPSHYRRLDLLDKKTLDHELLHGYFFNSGLSQLLTKDAQEAIVDMLAINLENIYNNSVKMYEYIKEVK